VTLSLAASSKVAVASKGNPRATATRAEGAALLKRFMRAGFYRRNIGVNNSPENTRRQV